MKKIILAGAIALTATAAQAQYGMGTAGAGSTPNSRPVQPSTTSGGTYVQPHQQTNSTGNNYSAYGNVNPYTGAVGTRNPK